MFREVFKMKKTGYVILWSVVGAMVIAIGIGLFFAIREKMTRITAETVDVSDWISDEDITVKEHYCAHTGMYPTASDTFINFASNGSYEMKTGTSSMAQGTYTVDKNVITTSYQSSYSSSSAEVNLLAEGNFIFFESNICSGDEIPDDDTFDATVSRVDAAGYGYQYEFRKDGTYTLTHGEAKDCRKWTVVDGTYKRNADNTLTVTLNDSDALPLYISHGHLVTSFYTEISNDEYDKAMKEAEEKSKENTEK